MKKSTALFQQLEQKVVRLCAEYADRQEKKVRAKFDRTLFSEDFQSVAFYFDEIRHTLKQMMQFDEEETERIGFLNEKLLAQCTALTEALQSPPARAKSAVNFRPVLSKREQRRQELNRLPPRERLAKYYDALQMLNEKIGQQTDLYQSAHSEQDKISYMQQIQITEQRRERCLEAIELLEEYLAFKGDEN